MHCYLYIGGMMLELGYMARYNDATMTVYLYMWVVGYKDVGKCG